MRSAAEAEVRYADLRLAAWISGLENGLLDPTSPWERVAASMKEHGSKGSWTAEKVKYAWHYGISQLYPAINIPCSDSGIARAVVFNGIEEQSLVENNYNDNDDLSDSAAAIL
jgi:hypothetical protein